MRLDLLTDLLAAVGFGTPGEDLFEEEMPADCRQGVLVRLPLEGILIEHELPGYFRGCVEVIVRAQTTAAGADLADRISAALTLNEQDLLDREGIARIRINFLRPHTLPIAYKRSDGNGKEWSINLDGSYVRL